MDIELTIPATKIDLSLLLRQKDELIHLRSKYPDNCRTFELFSGIIHLMDFIGDQLQEAVKDHLVCITDYDNWTSRFVMATETCPEVYRNICETALQCDDYIKMGSMDAIPATGFTDAHWEQFRRFGLNQEFETE